MTRPQMTRVSLFLSAALLALPLPAAARTLDLAFLPPAVEPQDLCIPAAEEPKPDDPNIGRGEDELTDDLRLRFIIRDIRRLQAEDADRWFDFILTLIDWRARLDPDFSAVDAEIARINLYIDAGRLTRLRAEGRIDNLRSAEIRLDNVQKMALAQFYLNGIGVDMDVPYAQSLIRESAYGGNPEALMSIARMELRGEPMPQWDSPLDLTVTLAFGGMLGPMNRSICGHAERIAREYVDGEVVTPNPDIAYAWYRFAADLGGGQAAWRVVEFHLNAEAGRKDNAELLHYLRLAVARGITLDDAQIGAVKSSGAVDEAELTQILGFNHSADTPGGRASVIPYLQLSVNLDAEEADEEGPYLAYLREVVQFDTAPGFVFTALANETLVRRGRWAAEREAMDLLETAVQRDDAEGMQLLAEMLMRYRRDPGNVARAVNLLTAAAERHGLAPALRDLDRLYRCQAPDAPRIAEADLWFRHWRGSAGDAVEVSPGDLISLDPYKKPEMLAELQTQALDGRPTSAAGFLERLQRDPFVTDGALRLWARRTNPSDKTMEEFARAGFAVAATAAERDLAVEFFRRVYLNNGVTTALDLSVALVEDNGRDPKVAQEIVEMLTQAGNRGEGNSIRLLSRVQAAQRPARDVYDEFAAVIEERGDFLALMFAIPFIDAANQQDYFERAVSIMSCGTKDADELGDAATIMGNAELTDRWRRIGLVMPGGHVLAKLNISDTQMALYAKGRAPDAREVEERNLAEGDEMARRNLFTLTADPDLPGFDPQAAAGHLLAVLATGRPDDSAWVIETFRKAGPDLRAAVGAKVDMTTVFRSAAERGDVTAMLELALILRAAAQTTEDLRSSARWLESAAKGGNVAAMAELGRVLSLGLGVPPDRAMALSWLDQAGQAGDAAAADLARALRVGAAP
jgi:TPR repeat protein